MALTDVIARLAVSLSMDTAALLEGATLAEKRMEQSRRRFAKIGRQMQGIGKNLSIAVTAPMVALGAASVRTGVEFQKSMTNVATLVDTASESMEKMSAQVLGVAQRVPVALDELTQGLYDVRSAGIGAGDAMTVLEKSAKLGVAGLGTTKEATDIVTSAINSFKLEGADAAKIYDNVFRTVKAGKTTISELGQSFGAVAPVVAQAGVKVDEFLAATAAMTTTGLPAAQAQTQLRAAIAGLTRDTKESAAAFKTLGAKSFTDLVQKSGGMVEAFSRLRELTGGNDAQLLKLVGSIEGYNAIVSLAGQTNKSFTETLAGMRSGVDAVDEAFLKQAGTTAAKWQQTQNSLQVSAIKISNALAPVLEKLADLLGKVSDWFSELDPVTQKWTIGLGALAFALGPVLSVVGNLLPLIVKLGPAMSILGKALIFLASNPYVLGLALVALGVYEAWKHWDEIAPILQRLWAGVKKFIGEGLTRILEGVLNPIGAVKHAFADLYDAVVGHSYVPDMVDGIAAQMARLDAVMVAPVMKATTKAQQAFRDMAAEVQAILDRLYPEVRRLLDFRADRATLQGSDLTAAQKADAIGRLNREFGGGGGFGPVPDFAGVGPLGSEGMARVNDRYGEFLEKLGKKTSETTTRIAKSFKDMATETLAAFDRLTSAIRGGGFLDILSSVVSLGLQLGSVGLFGKKFASSINQTVPGRAAGGPISAGRAYLVGERGPELVVPRYNGHVVPNHALGGSTTRVEIVDTTGLFVTRVNGQIMRAAPGIATGAAQGTQRLMQRQQTRRLA